MVYLRNCGAPQENIKVLSQDILVEYVFGKRAKRSDEINKLVGIVSYIEPMGKYLEAST